MPLAGINKHCMIPIQQVTQKFKLVKVFVDILNDFFLGLEL